MLTAGNQFQAYAIFMKLADLRRDTPADVCKGMFDELDRAAGEVTRSEGDELLPSPYGVILVKRRIVEAFSAVELLIASLGKVGIRISVGMDYGPFDPVFNVTKWNAAAPAINLAARLANLQESPQHVIVSQKVQEDALLATARFGNTFSDKRSGMVKRTPVEYYLAKADEYVQTLGIPPTFVVGSPECESADVVAFDIEGFSEQAPEVQTQWARLLNDCVHRTLRGFDSRLWAYGPAGDGGFFAFIPDPERSSRAAWPFACELQNQFRFDGLRVRIGVNNGPVLRRGDQSAVGGAILVADWLSGIAASGGVATSEHFWKSLHADQRVDWAADAQTADGIGVVSLSRRISPEAVESITRLIAYVEESRYLSVLGLYEAAQKEKDGLDILDMFKNALTSWSEEIGIIEQQYADLVQTSLIKDLRNRMRSLAELVKEGH
jgi:class 3 adenylate cyclase